MSDSEDEEDMDYLPDEYDMILSGNSYSDQYDESVSTDSFNDETRSATDDDDDDDDDEDDEDDDDVDDVEMDHERTPATRHITSDNEVIFVSANRTSSPIHSLPRDDSILWIPISDDLEISEPPLNTNDVDNQSNQISLVNNRLSQITNSPTTKNDLNVTMQSTQATVDIENTCIICTEPYSTSDSHHIVTLKCGHLFGKSCIEKWLAPNRRTQRCPQCNKPAKKREVLKIFSRYVRPLDTWERDHALEKAQEWEEKFLNEQSEKNQLKTENIILKEEIEDLKLKLINNSSNTESKYNRRNLASVPKANQKKMGKFKLKFLKQILVNERDQYCRFHNYVELTESFGVSIMRPVNRASLYDLRYGIKKIPLSSSKVEMIYIHSQHIKDMVCRQYDGTILTVSEDRTLKVTSLISKTIQRTVKLTELPWSVEFLPNNNNIVTVGFSSGNLCFYDIRRDSKPLVTISPKHTSSPIVSISAIQYRQNQQKKTGILAVHLDSSVVYNFPDDLVMENYKSFQLPYKGRSMASSFDPKSGLSVISYRPSKIHKNTSHYIFDFQWKEQNECLVPDLINILEGHSTEQIQLSKTKIYSNPLDDDSILVCAAENNGVMVCDYMKRYSQTPLPFNHIRTQAHGFQLFKNSTFSSPILTCLDGESLNLYSLE